MKLTKPDLKRIIAEEIKRVLKESLRDVYGGGQQAFDPDETPSPSGKVQTAAIGDPKKLLEEAKKKIDEALAAM